jgi:thiol-disulfide isomerase/thioredoxin
MVDFWATWCAPCKASFPAYSAMQKELADRGLTIVAVSVDKQREPYAEFVKKFAPDFATVRDGGQKLVSAMKVPGMPTCYLIDRKGVLRVIHSGFHGDASLRELREEITRLLEEKS